MTRERYQYFAPASVAEAGTLLSEPDIETVVIGGGTMIMPQLRFRITTPDRAIDLAMIPELRNVERLPSGGYRVGASVTYTQISKLVGDTAKALDVLQRVASGITGGPQVRNQATVCGSAAFANPSSDIPTALVASEAVVQLDGNRGPRSIPAGEFFTGAFQTQRRSDELIRAVDLPEEARDASWGYVKVKGSESSWPICTAAARILPPEDSKPAQCSVTLGAAIEFPRTLTLTTTVGGELQPSHLEEIESFLALEDHKWWDDQLATAEYRKSIAGAVMRRAIEKAIGRSRSHA